MKVVVKKMLLSMEKVTAASMARITRIDGKYCFLE